MSDLMSIFGISKRGMFAEQKALGVTSHNIANANTEGYSRQRVQRETTKPFCTPSMNSYIGPGQLGTGVEVTSIDRIRDNFLDFQVRKETATLGTYESRDKYLSEVESIFNEPSEYGLSTMISKFFESWYSLSKQPESSNTRTVVAQQAEALAKELNHTYKQLQDVKTNAHSEIKQQIFDMNSTLNQLDDLNQQIMNVKISGQNPNDLMDKRDVLLDKLSNTMNIHIDKKEFNAIDVRPGTIDGVPPTGEKLLVRKEPNEKVSRFSYISGTKVVNHGADYSLELSYMKLGNANTAGNTIKIEGLTESESKKLKKQIEECRAIWAKEDGTSYAEDGATPIGGMISINKKDINKLGLFIPKDGELQGLMSVQKEVDKYEDQLNGLAKGLALAVNSVHSGKEKLGDDNLPFFVNSEKAKYKKDTNNKSQLKDDYLKGDGEIEITAENVSINKELLEDVMKIKTGKDDDESKNGESDGNRALAIAELQYTLIKYQNVDPKTTRELFIEKMTGDEKNGKLQVGELGVKTIKGNVNGTKADAYFKDIVDELGIQRSEAKRIVGNQKTLLNNFQERRDSASGVSLDEEMANLVQFQHAYQANAKMISIVDQLLDVVVNGLIR